MLRTKEQYRQRLFGMKPNVCIGGRMVRRDDHRLIPGINVLDMTFDLAQNPKWKGLATATSSIMGEEINRWAHLPQNPYDLMQKQKLIRLAARRGGAASSAAWGMMRSTPWPFAPRRLMRPRELTIMPGS